MLPKNLYRWWDLCVAAEHLHGVESALILAILDRESLGGEALRPRGPEGLGDKGHGRGLMQIDDRYHKEFCAELMTDGSPAWANPWRNVEYGARLLHGHLERFLRRPRPTDAAIAAYNAGADAVDRVFLELTEPVTEYRERRELDNITTGQNYVTDVLRRRDNIRKLTVARPLA